MIKKTLIFLLYMMSCLNIKIFSEAAREPIAPISVRGGTGPGPIGRVVQGVIVEEPGPVLGVPIALERISILQQMIIIQRELEEQEVEVSRRLGSEGRTEGEGRRAAEEAGRVAARTEGRRAAEEAGRVAAQAAQRAQASKNDNKLKPNQKQNLQVRNISYPTKNKKQSGFFGFILNFVPSWILNLFSVISLSFSRLRNFLFETKK